MFEEYKYKIELHCHSAGISPCSDIPYPDVLRFYKEEGFSGIALTNHFLPHAFKKERDYNSFVEDYIQEYHQMKEHGEGMGIKVYLSVEIRFLESMNDYLLYGIDEDFIRAIPRECKSIYDFTSFAKDYDSDVLIIQAHPFRDCMTMVDPSLLDGIEVYNLHPNHNSRVGLAAKYAEEEGFRVCTCGTDFHHLGQHALTALLTKELPEDERALRDCMLKEQVYKIGKSVLTF